MPIEIEVWISCSRCAARMQVETCRGRAGDLASAREKAAEEGWLSKRGKKKTIDLCPVCSEQQRMPEVLFEELLESVRQGGELLRQREGEG